MNHWLVKSEPASFSIHDLASRPGQTEGWDGVRNYQARNYLRDQMKKGDLVLFYHSGTAHPAVAGLCTVVREGYPDATAWDPFSAHPDPRSTPDKPVWYQVDLRLLRIFSHPVSLKALKRDYRFQGLTLLKKGNRLSVMPIPEEHFHAILAMAETANRSLP